MDFKLIKFIVLQLLIQILVADTVSDIKYPKNEFNSNDSAALNQQFDLKIKNDLKKETTIKDVQNENLKLLIKDALKDIKTNQKELLPQRDNSKSAAQKEDKIEKLSAMKYNSSNTNKESNLQNPTSQNPSKDSILKDQLPISPTEELAEILIGTIVPNASFRNSSSRNNQKHSTNSTTNSTKSSTFDDLKIKVIEQIHLKAKIFFQAFAGSHLLRESTSAIKNKNDFLSNKINSIYSSTPYLKPYQGNSRPPSSNNWCNSLSNSFTQYSQLNAFLLAAFLLFPVTIPFYLLGWLTLFLLRTMFCIGAKQLFTNVIYRIRSS